MYSRSEVRKVNCKASTCICPNEAGRVDVLRNTCIATGQCDGRILNVSCYWGRWTAEHRFKGKLGIDGGRQNQENEGGEGLGKHLNERQLDKEWMEEQKIVVRFARDRDCEELDGKLKLLMNIARGHR
jgi:hypothetical protein